MDAMTFLEKRVASLDIDGYEIYRIRSRQLWIEAKDRQIESSQESEALGLAVQLFRRGQSGFASTSLDTEAFLERTVSLAYNSLDIVEAGIPRPLPSPAPWNGGADCDDGLRGRRFAEKAERALALEAEAKAFDRRVTRVRGARYQEAEEAVELRNSRQLDARYTRTLCELSLMVMAEEKGGQEMAWESEFSPFFSELDPSRPARRAAGQAVSLLGARPIATRKAPALLDPAVGASLLSVLASSLLGDQVMKGKSVLKDKVGEKIYSEQVTLTDDGLLKGGYATAPFDGEGVPAQRTAVVSAGRLNGFLHDLTSAVRLEAAPTGNGVRPVYKEIPRTGVTNFFVEPGDASWDDLRRRMGEGFWITDLIGVHTANPVTGDFSLGASGFWLQGGEQRPVRGVAVSGNIHDLFRKTVGVGSELRFYHAYGCPPLLISEIEIGGV